MTEKPIAFVVAGHYHADHVYGLQTFKEHANAPVWAHEAALEYLESAAAAERLEQRRGVLYPWIDERTRLVKPDRTFRDRERFDLGDTTIELVYAGPAHAPDDVIMIVKEPGVVFSGDLIFGRRLPFLGGEKVNTTNWLARLRDLESLSPKPRYLVPGHGPIATDAAEAIAFTRGYLEYLRTHMGRAAEELVPFDEACARTDWSRYRDLPTFEQANCGNAYQVYLEMQAAGF